MELPGWVEQMGVMMVHGGDQRQEEVVVVVVVVVEPLSTMCRRSGHQLCSEGVQSGADPDVRTEAESAQDGVITRDIHRTFPAHDYFKDSDGDGQDSLYKICKVRCTRSTPGTTHSVYRVKAYSVYDEEFGYCQGQSFLAAVLLLHMPEEQAFCVLVKIMYEYGLRSLYKNNFEDLHCKFYQLEKLLQVSTSHVIISDVM
ncbi:hypothetical protein CRUP_034984 [Coryphaenoides rupestris]|nr:hypothetical protein CRUP_034984 [Coryphaenoides rupestris]